MIRLIFITNDPESARLAVESGVDRIFVDLEIDGKVERQGHLDTLISSHSVDDVERVKAVIGDAQLLVRINPYSAKSPDEIDKVISMGADIIMLPMFKRLDEVVSTIEAISGRCSFIPLVETPEALDLIPELVEQDGVDEVYFGLNDLHLSLGLSFMFELVANGAIDEAAHFCREANKPFGFGGVARMDEGLLPGRLVLAEHLRMDSSLVILSRTFHRKSVDINSLKTNIDFKREVLALRKAETELKNRDEFQVESDHLRFNEAVNRIVMR